MLLAHSSFTVFHLLTFLPPSPLFKLTFFAQLPSQVFSLKHTIFWDDRRGRPTLLSKRKKIAKFKSFLPGNSENTQAHLQASVSSSSSDERDEHLKNQIKFQSHSLIEVRVIGEQGDFQFFSTCLIYVPNWNKEKIWGEDFQWKKDEIGETVATKKSHSEWARQEKDRRQRGLKVTHNAW